MFALCIKFSSQSDFGLKESIFLYKKLTRCLFVENLVDLSMMFINFIIMQFIFESTFTFCDCFSEKCNISTIRWMKKLKHELINYKINDVISSAKFLNCINLLLIDDAIEWIEINSDVVKILTEKNSSQELTTTFRNLFCERFLVKFIKTFIVNFDIELNDLRQISDEFINIY
jgi:hypothetical protein